VGGPSGLRALRVGVAAESRARGQLTDDSGAVFKRFSVDGAEDIQPDPEHWYVGMVKSYAPNQGYGFIECPEVLDMYKSDVFLHKNQVDGSPRGKCFPGDKVRFTLEMNRNGKPQARSIEPFAEEPPVSPTKNFVGKVKKYSADQGYGFVECEETFSIFKGDIFLHRNQVEAANIVQGNLVTFSVEVSSKGQPQARNVERIVTNSFTEGKVQEPQ